MHALFHKIMNISRYVTQIQGIRTKWDNQLIKSRCQVYMMTPDKTMVVTHVFMKKLQTAKWSTDKAGVEAPLTICVGILTPSTKE